MSEESPASSRALHVLVLAPTGRDAQVLVRALSVSGLEAEACASIDVLCRGIEDGAGAAIVAAETLLEAGRDALQGVLASQPGWSDFPVLLMDAARAGRGPSPLSSLSIPHAVVLVRPVHSHTLVSTVRQALRSRSRQYQVRDELIERWRAERALLDSNARKDEFLAMLGHELRNPLAAIRNATELIKMRAPADEILERAGAVLDRQTTHVARLIDGLLEVSRIARGKIEITPVPLDLRAIVEETLEDRAIEIAAAGLRVTRDLPDEPVCVRADGVRLVQVLDNILGNAIKFTGDGGRIDVSLAEEDGYATLRIADTGVGMTPAILEVLFDPFQQASQDIARASGGLGLGLALAKGLVDLHDGTIEARSAGIGRGSELVVRLPLAPRDLPASAARPSTTSRPRRVLVVEDNVDAGTSLRDLLQLLGHDATVVGTGPCAIETLRRRRFDIVLCDLGLPGVSGYEVARRVRSDAVSRETPLVALTGYGQPADRARTAAAGFDEHLIKPIDVAALNEVLGLLCGQGPGVARDDD